MKSNDKLHRFLFEEYAIRGELVTMSSTLSEINQDKHWPPVIEKLMAELVVSTSLLTATLKFEGDITLQLQGDGLLKFAVVNGNHCQQMRGVAKIEATPDKNSTLSTLAGDAILAITVRPIKKKLTKVYIAIEKESIAQNLELWFDRSQQLPTRLIIRHNKLGAAGILLQIMPSQQSNIEALNHLAMLAETVTGEELLTLTAEELLWRLYHQEKIITYPPVDVSFACSCSRERCNNLLFSLTLSEIVETLKHKDCIDIHCEQCGKHYIYKTEDITNLGLLVK